MNSVTFSLNYVMNGGLDEYFIKWGIGFYNTQLIMKYVRKFHYKKDTLKNSRLGEHEGRNGWKMKLFPFGSTEMLKTRQWNYRWKIKFQRRGSANRFGSKWHWSPFLFVQHCVENHLKSLYSVALSFIINFVGVFHFWTLLIIFQFENLILKSRMRYWNY